MQVDSCSYTRIGVYVGRPQSGPHPIGRRGRSGTAVPRMYGYLHKGRAGPRMAHGEPFGEPRNCSHCRKLRTDAFI